MFIPDRSGIEVSRVPAVWASAASGAISTPPIEQKNINDKQTGAIIFIGFM